MKKEESKNMNSEELLQHLMKNVSEEKRRFLMEKIGSSEQGQNCEKNIENTAEQASATEKNTSITETHDEKAENQSIDNTADEGINNDTNDSTESESNEHRGFDALLQQIGEKGGEILSQEERDFFFRKSDNPDVLVETVEKEPEIFEEVMLAPVFLDIKKLLYLNLAFLGVLIFVVSFSAYLQSVNQKLQNNTLVSLRNMESRQSADTERLWEFFTLPPEIRKKELKLRVDSHLATKNEKRACYFLLATMSFEEQDFSSGREYMLKGVQLSDEKK
jgi:superfamily II DNA helicase RecQ